jgi:hypothetical protein
MAKQLTSFTFSPRTRQGKSLYPWGQWLNCKPWQLTKGQDFKSSVESFRSLAYRVARDKGLVVRIETVKGGLVIMAEPASPAQLAKWQAADAEASGASGQPNGQTTNGVSEEQSSANGVDLGALAAGK